MPKKHILKTILENIDFTDNSDVLYPLLARSDMALVSLMFKKYPGKFKGLDKEDVRKSLYNARNSKYIKRTIMRSKDKGEITEVLCRISLTKKGKKLLGRHKFENLQIQKPKKWDKQWRIVMYDIPKKYNYGRDVLRDKLKNMGFFQFQRSVWIYPYACKKEIDFITEFFGLQKYVTIFEGRIGNDHKLRQYFKKRKKYKL